MSDNTNITEAPDKTAAAQPSDGLFSQAYQWLKKEVSGDDSTATATKQADATKQLVDDKTLPSLDLSDTGKGAKPADAAPRDGTTEKAGEQVKTSDATKDTGAGQHGEKFDSSKEFLKAHPELHVPSHKEEVHLQKQADDLKTSIAEKQANEDKVNSVAEKMVKFSNDLKAIGVTDLHNRDDIKAKIDAQPPEVRQRINSEFQDLRSHPAEIKQLQDGAALKKEMNELQAEKIKLGHVEDKLALKSDLAAIDKLPQDKREAVYQSMDHILNRHDKTQTTELKESERLQVVKDLAHQLAHPEDIKQGNKGTCALASSEFVLAKERPDVYAKAIDSLATHGELKGAKLSKADIHGDDGDPERSMASKLFQTAAANLAVMDSGGRYENHKPGEAPAVTAGKTPSDDSGERLITKDGKVEDWPGVTHDGQADVLRKITGENFQVDKLYAWNSESFQTQLEQEAKQYGYPIKIGFTYPDGSAHAVSITGIDKSTNPPSVTYDDTAQPRGESQRKSIKEIYSLALEGPSVENTSMGKIMILTSSSDGSRTDPYVEVIRPPKGS